MSRTAITKYPIVFLLMLLLAQGVRAEQSLRQRININREWTFRLGDYPGAEQPDYSEESWSRIHLPHDFSLPYFRSSHWYTGYGWYRKPIDVPETWKGKRVFIEFEGAFRVAQLFVNGQLVGEHQGGYTGFSFDITQQLHPGRNQLAVRLNNLYCPRLAPRNGDHQFTGGIYRDVSLVVTDPVHVTWYGTFVTTPQLSHKAGRVFILTEVCNQSSHSKKYTLQSVVFDPFGKAVAKVSTTQVISPDSTVEFKQESPEIRNPKLWHPQHPWLYKVVSTVLDGKKRLDRYETPFGFRWFTFTADRGFFLNGEHYYFRGANVHQDHAGWANAVTNRGILRDVRMIKDCGMDFIRGSHYPHDPSFSDACDSLGILFWAENDFWGSGGNQQENDNWFEGNGAYPLRAEDQPSFEESVKTDLREMIRIHRNHPSIIVWSLCNEPFFTDGRTLPKVQTFLKELTGLAHALDPSRPVGIGGCQRGSIDTIGDVAGYNGDGARLFLNPGIPSVVTEYGSTIAKRPGRYIPGWGDLQKEKFPWRSGEALWCAFDYGTRAGDFGMMGMVDYFRLPKNTWYWYRNEYRHIPPPEPAREGIAHHLKLTSDATTIHGTDGTDDAHLIVSVLDEERHQLSNTPIVTLQILSGPGEFPTGRNITFAADSDISIRDGKAAIEFRSYEGGVSRIRASSPGLLEDTISIVTEGLPTFLNGVTRLAEARPYTRFVWTKPTPPKKATTNLAYQKPTRASSESIGKTAEKANDKDTTTFWQPMENAEECWWQVDLENLYNLSDVQLFHSSEEGSSFRIEVSVNGQDWELFSNRKTETTTGLQRGEKSLSIRSVRFVRITFTRNKTALIRLREVQIYGENASNLKI